METNSVKPLELENVLDPRLDAMRYAQEKMKWGIFKGPSDQTWVHQQANSYSTSGCTWNFNTQSENVLIDRVIYIQHQFKVTFVGTCAVGQPLLNTDADAPRCFPLAAITQTAKCTINGTSFDMQYADNMEAMLRYNNEFDLRHYDFSQTPSMLDTYQSYADAVGGARNPLASYDNDGYELGRGSFFMDVLTNPLFVSGTTTSVAVFTVVEPLLISPLAYSARHKQAGLIGVKNMGVQMSFKAGKLERVWSHAVTAGVTITSVTVDIGQGSTEPPQLFVNYLSPPMLDSIGEMPTAPVYQYYKFDTFINNQNTNVAGGNDTTVTINSIQLSTVPKSIYIWATLPEDSKTYATTDTFFRLNSLSLMYLNKSGQFSNMNTNDLYAMAVKNGTNISWSEWYGITQAYGVTQDFDEGNPAKKYPAGGGKGLTGSVLRIDVEDLALPDNLSAGCNVNSQLQFTANFTNLSASSQGIQVNTICVYDGIVTITKGTCISQIGIISQADVIETRQNKSWVPYHDALGVFGGNLFSKLGHLASKACDIISVGKLAKKALSGSGVVGGMLLDGDEYQGGANVGGAPVGGRRVGRPCGSKKERGGELLSGASLKDRLMKGMF